MNAELASLNCLVEEYEALVDEVAPPHKGGGEVDWTRLEDSLMANGDWSRQGAAALINLARQYGSFVLRNACALALVLGIEDGKLGL